VSETPQDDVEREPAPSPAPQAGQPTGQVTAAPAGKSTEQHVLRLDHFLKLRNLTETGGQAKLLIQEGKVKVNGVVDTRRRRKLVPGDVVEVNGRKLTVRDA
jgi:ribosome-associated protein